MPPKRFTANPLAAPRYRAGKPLPANEASSSESESESGSENEPDDGDAEPGRPAGTAPSVPRIAVDVDIKAREARAVAARVREAAERKRREEDEEGFVTASDSEDENESDGGDESEEESEDDDDYSSEEEGARRRFVAPTFVKRGARREQDGAGAEGRHEFSAAEEEQRRRMEKADEMLKMQIEREVRERAEGKKDWDDEEGLNIEDVDDTDGVDPEAEHAAWKLRELKRVKREREAIEVTEKEREEVERRRNLSKEDREAEDKEWIDKQKEEKEGRGQMGFMQKYFHKGAFFQDDGDEEVLGLKNRDVAGRRFQDDAVNRELLPQYMQIRDMTKLGKKGRTRYKDLKNEDTGRFGVSLYDQRGRGEAGGRYKDGSSGANNTAIGERRPREDDRSGREEKRQRYD